jgi:2-methylfumaryl-CoA isomerase
VLPAWDIATGLLAVSGLLSGLHRRATTGEGSRVDLALSDVAASHVANLGWLAEAAERGGDRPRLGNHMYGAFGVDFVCADDRRVIVVAITRQQWRDLMRITHTEEIFATLADLYDADFDEEGQRFENRAMIEAVLGPWFARRNSAQVLQAAVGSRVMIGEFRSPHEVVEAFRDGLESAVLTEVEQPGVGRMLTATSPLRWDSQYPSVSPAPVIGSDTAQVLRDVLGLSPAHISQLVDAGAIAPARPSDPAAATNRSMKGEV